MLKTLSVKLKLSLALAVTILFLAIVALFSLTGLGEVVTNAQEVLNGKDISFEMTQKETDHLRWAHNVRHNLAHKNHVGVETDPRQCSFGKWYYGEGRKRAEDHLPAIRGDLAAIEKPHADLHTSAITIDNHIKSGDRDAAAKTFEDESSQYLAEVSRYLHNVRNVVQENVMTDEAMLKAASNTRTRVLSISIFAIVLGILLAFVIARAILKNLNNISEKAQEIAEGNLDAEIAVDSKDEIGSMADSLTAMVGNIKDKLDILAKIPTPVMAVDRDMSITFINPAGASVGGLTPEQCQGKKCWTVFNTEHCQTGKCAVKQAMQQDANVTAKTIARPNGKEIPIQYTGATIKDERGNIVGAIEYVADITEIDKMVKETEEVVDTVASVMKSAADKNMTSRVKKNFSTQFMPLKDNVNMTLENLENALQQVQSSVEQVSSGSSQISTGSQTLSQGAQEQASSLEEISSSMEEMASMTRQNADNANQAKSLSGAAQNSADQGNKAMDEMTSAIDKIKKSSDETAKIVKTIDEIAFQTNLLALNAAVEAARAGDAGRGFAVVAEEVRNLASRSAEAAKNTASMIDESVKNAEGGVSITQEVGKFLSDINEGTKKVNDLVTEIAAASSEQSRGIEQVNNAIAQMNQLTQQNAANSEESASAAEEMTSQAQELAAMVSTFSLTNGGSSLGTRQQRQLTFTHQKQATAQEQPMLMNTAPNPAQASAGGNGGVKPEAVIPMDKADLQGF